MSIGLVVNPSRTIAFVLLAISNAGEAGAQHEPWMLGPFTKPAGINPIIAPNVASTFRSPMGDSVVHWEEYATFNPAAIVRNGRIYVLYRAEDASGKEEIGFHTSRLGLAESGDGLHFTRQATPVLYPGTDAQRSNEWPGGVEDPRVVEAEDGTYVLTYTQWNRDVPRLAVATSNDLIHWTKHGPAFAKVSSGKYLRTESKSGAILTRMVGGRLLAVRLSGRYWMYYGVPNIGIATSDNLRDWTPLEATNGEPLHVLSPRAGFFDAWLVEAGPPVLLTDRGILVLYNAGNDRERGDSTLPTGVYTGGQALFDARDPTRLIARSSRPFIQPTESYERTGQYQRGTTFVEGLVPFKGQWFLYYGTADSRVGVAVAPQSTSPRP
ncbi:MAG TPA: glycoside hydrolase family 130 protein [Gemmatimonadaceae bacterium]|nr:glycoside hydrolase family 130 protein [Gemmatimonadaceae bacterium]